jgi:hypothetical protein
LAKRRLHDHHPDQTGKALKEEETSYDLCRDRVFCLDILPDEPELKKGELTFRPRFMRSERALARVGLRRKIE